MAELNDPGPGSEGAAELGCEEALDRLAAYLDGELVPDETAALERHLEKCRSCWSRAEFERRLHDRIRSDLEARSVSHEFEERVREIVRGFTSSS